MSEPTLSSNNVMVVNMRNYVAPIVTEEPSKKWVNYGQDNNYFEYLLDRYKGSPTNHALINGIFQMIVGEGLDSEMKQVHPEWFAEANTLFPYDELLKWAFDYKWGGFYIMQVIRSKDLSKIVSVKHTPVQNWRSGKADENGKIHEMYYSDDWSKYTSPRYRPEPYPVYDPKVPTALSILCVKPYRAGSFYYPSVDYQGGLQYAHIEEEISNFHINNLLNGMFPGLLVNFNNGIPSEDERKRIEDLINFKWGGSTNAGKIIVAFNDSSENSATVSPVTPQDLDKMFDLLNTQSSEKIMICHRVVSPTLFGVRTGAGLGNNADELRVASILFEETVLRLYRKLMINNMEDLLEQNKNYIKLDFKSLNPFPDFLQTEEKPNKMNEPSGATVQASEHSHVPEMSTEMEKAYLDMIDPVGEVVSIDDWAEMDTSKVTDETGEQEMFSDNGGE